MLTKLYNDNIGGHPYIFVSYRNLKNAFRHSTVDEFMLGIKYSLSNVVFIFCKCFVLYADIISADIRN